MHIELENIHLLRTAYAFRENGKQVVKQYTIRDYFLFALSLYCILSLTLPHGIAAGCKVDTAP
jgi:hypothetical protein